MERNCPRSRIPMSRAWCLLLFSVACSSTEQPARSNAATSGAPAIGGATSSGDGGRAGGVGSNGRRQWDNDCGGIERGQLLTFEHGRLAAAGRLEAATLVAPRAAAPLQLR